MKRYFFSLTFVFVIVSFQAQSNKQPVIASVKGYLYYNQNKYSEKSEGTFSKNIIDTDFVLWNTMIGEGSATGYSNNTFVAVEVANSTADEYFSGYVRLIVSDESNKILFSRMQSFSLKANKNTYTAPFMIYETGCETWKLKVELLDSSKKKVFAVVNKVIAFACGE